MALIPALRLAATSLRGCLKEALHRRRKPSSAADSQPCELTAQETTAYFRLLAAECPEVDWVDDRTWSDLEMDRVFIRLNKSTTPLGAQHLYAMLRGAQSGPERLGDSVRANQAFAANPEAGAALRRALRQLRVSESAQLGGFLLGSLPALPRWYRLFYLLSAATVFCSLGMFFSPWFLFPALALWLLNIVLHCVYRPRFSMHVCALRQLATLVGCALELPRALPGLELPELRELRSLKGNARDLQKQLSKTFLRMAAGNDLALMAMEYLNLLCLFELCAFCRAIVAMKQQPAALLRIFQCVGRLDAFQGLASALGECPLVCTAELKAGRQFTLLEVYHPLLEQPVHNSLQGSGQCLLFTGTNMAGKTTFIKTLALNVLLAQTIGMCFARKAVVPAARLKTLINREDTIAAGQSYFFFEASELRRMLEEARHSCQEVWFVLDEVFRGTNTLERVAAAAAVLGHLAQQGMVLASTHDHELTSLLAAQFDSYHFVEIIEGHQTRFDYRLRSGPCTSRNALRLLALAGYPEQVVSAAQKLVTGQEGRLAALGGRHALSQESRERSDAV
jgi:hypothetical protein